MWFYKMGSCLFCREQPERQWKKMTATAVDNKITDAIFKSTTHSGITEINILDPFPIFTILQNSCDNHETNNKGK